MNLGHLVDRERADPAADWNLLSLAEKQQLGVARLLLKSPSFAVLDEATSAMDAEVESDLFEKLKRSGITLVTVTHRASLLRFHERILTIKGGDERSWSLKAVEAGDEECFASPRKTPVTLQSCCVILISLKFCWHSNYSCINLLISNITF